MLADDTWVDNREKFDDSGWWIVGFPFLKCLNLDRSREIEAAESRQWTAK